MKVAILGAGNDGKAAAADLTSAGHTVNLFEFPEFEHNLRSVREKGGIHVLGVGRNGVKRKRGHHETRRISLPRPGRHSGHESAFEGGHSPR